MSKSDEYRARACACEEQAHRVTDRTMKQQWQDMAIQWHYMANQADRLLGKSGDESKE